MKIETDEQLAEARARQEELKEVYQNTPFRSNPESNEYADIDKAIMAYYNDIYMSLGSILYRLRESRIFSIEVNNEEKMIKFQEECDNHFEDNLTKEELKQLVKELDAIADSL